MKKQARLLLTGLCAAALLAGCGGQQNNAETLPAIDPQPVVAEKPAADVIKVNNTAEFLQALGSDRVIQLPEGDFQLEPGDAPENPSGAFIWGFLGEYMEPDGSTDTKDAADYGATLTIRGLNNLTIRGAGADKTTLFLPGGGDLSFAHCNALTLEGFAIHDNDSEFFGPNCIQADYCWDVNAGDLKIPRLSAYETGNLQLENCRFFGDRTTCLELGSVTTCRITNCRFADIMQKEANYSILSAWGGSDFVIRDTVFENNRATNLMTLHVFQEPMRLENCTIRGNTISKYLFDIGDGSETTFTISGCSGENNTAWDWLGPDYLGSIVDETGKTLSDTDLEGLFGSIYSSASAAGPRETVTVTTADEFLAAIGPDREIILDAPLIDLSTASDYGGEDQPYYYWDDPYDGPQLVIHDVNNLTIRGKDGKHSNVISAVPRYAQVLYFRNCNNLTVQDLTAGHTEEPGYCMGGVLEFESCGNVVVSGTGLYGCGTIGIQAMQCRNMTLQHNEIYDCSYGGILLSTCRKVDMTDNTFRDLGKEYGEAYVYNVIDSADVTFDGSTLLENDYRAYEVS